MKQDAEVLLMLRERARGRTQEQAATRAMQPLHSALGHMAGLVQRVIAHTQQRMIDGGCVPASAKLVSLFEPHTAIVRRGKAHLPAEFGRKIMLDEVEGGLVTRYALLPGNPPDASELPQSLAHHQARFDSSRRCSPPTARSSRSTTNDSLKTSRSAQLPCRGRGH
jgi:IS5 family transposase